MTSINSFDNAMKDLAKDYNEAYDNDKFLSTLERQFKNLASNSLDKIEETLPSLMNGLKLFWIISRHFKSDEKMPTLLSGISNEIADKIESKINLADLLTPSEERSYETQLEEAMGIIIQGKRIMQTWIKLYQSVHFRPFGLWLTCWCRLSSRLRMKVLNAGISIQS